MIKKIALVGAATVLAISMASAQTSAPSGTAGGAVGTSKKGNQERGTTGMSPKGTAAPTKGHSSKRAKALHCAGPSFSCRNVGEPSV
jgi:hypothetical protein